MWCAAMFVLSLTVAADHDEIDCEAFPALTRVDVDSNVRADFDQVSHEWDSLALELVTSGSTISRFELREFDELVSLGAETLPLVVQRIRLSRGGTTKYVTLFEDLVGVDFETERDTRPGDHGAKRRAIDYWLDVLSTCRPDRYPRDPSLVQIRARDLLEEFAAGDFVIPWDIAGQSGGDLWPLPNGREVSRWELMVQATVLADLGPHAIPVLTESLPRQANSAIRMIIDEALIQITLVQRLHVPLEAATVESRMELYRHSLEKWSRWYREWLERRSGSGVGADADDESP